MTESIVFTLKDYEPDSWTLEKISELNMKLLKLGAVIHLGKDGNDVCCEIKYDTEQLDNAITRGAGRKRKRVEGYTVGDVRRMLDMYTAEIVADVLGVSRATLYRRLKNRGDHEKF